MHRLAIFIFLFIISFPFIGQTGEDSIAVNPQFQLKGKITEEDNPVHNVTITLSGLDSVFIISTGPDGVFEFPEKSAKGIFILSFEKKGYVKKTVLIDLTVSHSQIIDDLSVLDLSPSMVKKKKLWGYKKIEKDFYLLKVFLTDQGYIEIDTKFTSVQVNTFNQFIKNKHHYAKG